MSEQLTAGHFGIRILSEMFIQHSVADLITDLVCEATKHFDQHKAQQYSRVSSVVLARLDLIPSSYSDPLQFICVDKVKT